MNLLNAAPGHDSIPMSLFKENINTLIKIITHICNLSLSSGVFPSDLMLAIVACIYKAGNPELESNYRPISVLPAFSKILEKIVCNQLLNYFIRNNLLTSSQYGFLPGLSTVDAVYSIVNGIYDAFDRGETPVGVFLDLKKAFDTIDRNKLLQKLKVYGIEGTELNWFRSYLSARRQLVAFRDETSTVQKVDYGVAQGSIVGPLLYVIYINDIVACSDKLQFTMYADDSSCSLSSPNLHDTIGCLNDELVKVSRWLTSNCLTLNVSKCHYIIFRRKNKKMHNPPPILILINEILEEKICTKFLGLMLDRNLCFQEHINYVTKKLSKYVPIMYQIRHNMPAEALRTIYNTLIFPCLCYCNGIWGSVYVSNLKPLQIIQKRIIKAMYFKPIRYPSAELFVSKFLLSVEQINKYTCFLYVFKSMHSSSEPE